MASAAKSDSRVLGYGMGPGLGDGAELALVIMRPLAARSSREVCVRLPAYDCGQKKIILF